MPSPFRLLPLFVGSACIFGQEHSLGDVIVVAADSRAVAGDGNKNPDICKIRIAGDYFFTLHGVGDADILAGISEALRASGTLSAKAIGLRDKYVDTILRRLQSAPELKTSGIMIFGRERGILKLVYVQFLAHAATPSERSHIYECPGTDCPGGIVTNSASPYGDQLSTNARTLDDVREFVTSQIDKARKIEQSTGKVEFVGAPLQSMRLNKSGKHEWRDKPDVCIEPELASAVLPELDSHP